MVKLVHNRTTKEKLVDFFNSLVSMILIFFGAIFKLNLPSRTYSKQEANTLKLSGSDLFSVKRSKPTFNSEPKGDGEDDQPKKRMGGIKDSSEIKGPSCSGGGGG